MFVLVGYYYAGPAGGLTAPLYSIHISTYGAHTGGHRQTSLKDITHTRERSQSQSMFSLSSTANQESLANFESDGRLNILNICNQEPLNDLFKESRLYLDYKIFIDADILLVATSALHQHQHPT